MSNIGIDGDHAWANMGHGQIVHLFDRGSDRWELVFNHEEKGKVAAPPLVEINAEAIGRDGRVHALSVAAGGSEHSVFLGGTPKDAQRARIKVIHGDHFHTREVDLPGRTPAKVVSGSKGGSLIDMGDGLQVEVAPGGFGRWQLAFADKGKPTTAPPIDDIKAESIHSDGLVRALTLAAGTEPSALFAIGRVNDATHVRLSVTRGGRTLTRAAPVMPAEAK